MFLDTTIAATSQVKIMLVHEDSHFLVTLVIPPPVEYRNEVKTRIVLFDSNHKKDDDRDYSLLNEVLNTLGYDVGTYVIKQKDNGFVPRDWPHQEDNSSCGIHACMTALDFLSK